LRHSVLPDPGKPVPNLLWKGATGVPSAPLFGAGVEASAVSQVPQKQCGFNSLLKNWDSYQDVAFAFRKSLEVNRPFWGAEARISTFSASCLDAKGMRSSN
jgi:hypothetical protein